MLQEHYSKWHYIRLEKNSSVNKLEGFLFYFTFEPYLCAYSVPSPSTSTWNLTYMSTGVSAHPKCCSKRLSLQKF